MPRKMRTAAAAIAGLSLAAVATLPAPALSGMPELAVAVTQVRTPEPRDAEQQELAEILGKVLPSHLERAFGENLKNYVWVDQLWTPLPEDEPEQFRVLLDEMGDKFKLLLSPTVEPGEKAYILRIALYDLGAVERPQLPGAVSETVALAPGADFSEIEIKIDELAQRLARRVATGRTVPSLAAVEEGAKRVLIWCIHPYDPSDARVATIGRQLTLELPYLLTQQMSADRYNVAGISPHEYFRACSALQRGADGAASSRLAFEQYDYIVSGQLFPDRGGGLLLSLLVDPREKSFAVPLSNIEIGDKLDDETYSKVASRFAAALLELSGR